MRHFRPVSKPIAPFWALAFVLDMLCDAPFEPMESVNLKILSYKTALLVSLVSAKRIGDLSVLSVHCSCMQFTLGKSKVTLCTNAALYP